MQSATALYETAAQVIPVLFIAFAFELLIRVKWVPAPGAGPKGRWGRVTDVVFVALILILFYAGEWAAFSAIDSGQPTDWHRSIVITTLVFGGLIIVWRVLITWAFNMSMAHYWIAEFVWVGLILAFGLIYRYV